MTEIKTERLSLKAIQALLADERRVIPAALYGESTTQSPVAHLEPSIEAPKVLIDEDLHASAVPLAPGPLLTFDQALRRGPHEGGKETLITMLTVSVMSAVTLVWAFLVL